MFLRSQYNYVTDFFLYLSVQKSLSPTRFRKIIKNTLKVL